MFFNSLKSNEDEIQNKIIHLCKMLIATSPDEKDFFENIKRDIIKLVNEIDYRFNSKEDLEYFIDAINSNMDCVPFFIRIGLNPDNNCHPLNKKFLEELEKDEREKQFILK